MFIFGYGRELHELRNYPFYSKMLYPYLRRTFCLFQKKIIQPFAFLFLIDSLVS